ncbi:MAG: hypothetical protein JXB88_05365 [Spirochaetales bacterium]|nr:hypothetical protein [Spirochaetales bacterium]
MQESNIVATKFYFINPVDLLIPVIDALIRVEFETYIIQGEDKEKLFKIMDIQSQHVIFISLRNRKDALDWLESSSIISRRNHIRIKLGAFVYSTINEDILDDFRERGIAIIPSARIREKLFEVVRQIVTLFDANNNNRRKYIRARAQGKCLALLQKRDHDHTIRAEILDISTHAFTCKIDPKDEEYLQKNFYKDVFLSLKGMQIQISARLIEYREDDVNGRVYLFTICGDGREPSQAAGSQKIPTFIRKRLYSFIRNFLFDDIRQRLGEEYA